MTYALPEDDALLTREALRRPANEMINAVKRLLRGCKDADVTFIPVDTKAYDSAAARPEETGIAWTLGHLIAHVTASSEECAVLAADQARRVPYHGRSRHEVPWQTLTTVPQLRRRLEESRRMRLASLDLWPDQPELSLTDSPWDAVPAHNAIKRFLL